MKESTIKSYEELPLFLNANQVSQLLGISISRTYELMRDKKFPSMTIGKRTIVPKDKLLTWIDEQTNN